MSGTVNIDGADKVLCGGYVNVDGVWKKVFEDGGGIKRLTFSSLNFNTNYQTEIKLSNVELMITLPDITQLNGFIIKPKSGAIYLNTDGNPATSTQSVICMYTTDESFNDNYSVEASCYDSNQFAFRTLSCFPIVISYKNEDNGDISEGVRLASFEGSKLYILNKISKNGTASSFIDYTTNIEFEILYW